MCTQSHNIFYMLHNAQNYPLQIAGQHGIEDDQVQSIMSWNIRSLKKTTILGKGKERDKNDSNKTDLITEIMDSVI